MSTWSNQFSGCNNIYYDMPPMMSDGRNYATWQPEAVVNNKIREQEGIKSNWHYRRFLQNNAKDIMKYNTNEAINASGNNPYTMVNNHPSSNVPLLYKSNYDNSKPTYGLHNSDLKNDYRTREQLNGRMVAPTIPTNFN